MTAVLIDVLLVMTILGAVSSWMLKLASEDLVPTHLLVDWHFWAGGLGYLMAALLNIWVLRHLDLSLVLPVTALTYVWTLLIGKWFLSEPLNRAKVAGVGAILVGVLLIAVS